MLALGSGGMEPTYVKPTMPPVPPIRVAALKPSPRGRISNRVWRLSKEVKDATKEAVRKVSTNADSLASRIAHRRVRNSSNRPSGTSPALSPARTEAADDDADDEHTPHESSPHAAPAPLEAVPECDAFSWIARG